MSASRPRGSSSGSARLAAVGVLAALLAFCAAGCSGSGGQGTASAGSTASGSSSGRYWIMGQRVFTDMTSDPAARDALAGDTVYVLEGSAAGRAAGEAAGIHVVETAYFTSEATLAARLPGLPPGTGAVLYDNEHWSLTPPGEQADPASYYQKAEALVHSAGYVFIATPTPVTVVPSVARYADVVDVQAQSVQAAPSEYSGRVLPIAREIRHADPKVIIVSGLSTNPSQGIPTATQLVDDAHSVAGDVQGYWLNIPQAPRKCFAAHANYAGGRCRGPQPQLGVRFLQLLGPAR